MKKVFLYSTICFIIVFILGITSVIVYKSCPLCVDELKEIGPAGDAIAGLSAIVLGALGVAATFAAFYIQYQANVSLHKDSLKEGYDRKFFELVNLFTQTVNTLKIKVEKERNFKDRTGNPYEYIQGKSVFQFFHDDFISLYSTFADLFKEKSVWVLEGLMHIAFSIVYYGKDHPESEKAMHELTNILTNRDFTFSEYGPQNTDELKERIDSIISNFQISSLNISYNELLCHYFKQLYFIIKFVFDSKEVLNEQKKNYFSMLCGQLSFNEQLMLFYSWIAKLEYGLSESQLTEIFSEYGLINDVLNSKDGDDIDINFILSVHRAFEKHPELYQRMK